MRRQCVVLAGGLGTRLGALTAQTPKPMLPVAGRPMLACLCESLRTQGIERITILAGHFGEQVAAAFAGAPGVEVLIEPEPLGTGGALRFAAAQGALEESFFLMNGDTFFDVNLAGLAAAPLSDAPAPCLGRLALRTETAPGRYGTVRLEGTRITAFVAKSEAPGGPALMNGGVYLLSRSVLARVPAGASSLEADLFPKLAAEGRLHGIVVERPFIDIGIPEDYARAETLIPAQLERPALFLDRDGVINVEIGHLHRIEDFVWIEGAAETIRAASDRGWHVFVVTNQGGVGRGLYGEAQVAALHGWIADQVWRAGGRISDFRYCPHHPEGAVPAYTRPCSWRKPAPGMLLDLMARHRVDRARSLMVGDRETDMVAAAAAGVRGVLFPGGDLAAFVRPHLEAQAA